jgi:hypothetical protein
VGKKDWAPTGMSVWLLVYTHKHGMDASVYTTREKALDSAIDIVREYMDELEPEDAEAVTKLIKAGKLDSALQRYTDATSEFQPETFEIDERTVQ